MNDISVLGPNFSSYGTLTDIKGGTVTKDDSGSWRINFEVIKGSPLSNHLTRKNYLELNGQKFTIREAITVRQGEEKYVKVSAEHVIHELEDHIVIDEYTFTGTIAEHIEELLSHQTGSDFEYSSGSGLPTVKIPLTITIPAGDLASGLKRILANYSAKLLLDNYNIKPVSKLYTIPSNITMEYAVQNNNIARTYSREGVVTRLVCRASVEVKAGDEEPGEVAGDYREVENVFGDDGGYRSGITRFMDLGVLDEVEHMETIANAFLDVYAEPEASYELDFAELTRISDIYTIYPGRDFAIDVGMSVTVKDLELGINLYLPVKSYTFSITNPDALSRITLGNFKYFEVPNIKPVPEDVIIQEKNVGQWAETVMSYVNEILGGSIRDVNAGLLVYTPLTGTRKTLSMVVSRLAFMKPDYTGVKYNNPFRVEDPLATIQRMKFGSIQMASNVIKNYITDTVGGSGVVTSINSAYSSTYGTGSIASFAPDTGATVFGDKYGPTTVEFLYAKDIVVQLNNLVGNTSEIYLEIGGGNGGVIGAINNLYDMLVNHGITVSGSHPDDSKGKDGDLWFRFVDEDE